MIYQFSVILRGVYPLVWRRLQVQEETSLKHLHQMLQIVMGWENCHLHEFGFSGKRYGELHPESDAGVLDERKFRVSKLTSKPGDVLKYRCDYGDGWEHDVFLEAVTDPNTRKSYPACLAGARTCPPEDVGGARGYGTYLQALADPKHAKHSELLARQGRFNPEYFSAAIVNSLLKETFPASKQKAGQASVRTGFPGRLLPASYGKSVSDAEKVHLSLSARDAELLVEHSWADEDLVARLRPGLQAAICQVACYEAGELDELLGFVAAQANHSGKTMEKEWDGLYDRMSAALSG